MNKKRVLKHKVSYILYAINVMLILINVMLLAELNECILFYSISVNIIMINTIIIKRYSSKDFNNTYMNIFKDNELIKD